MLTTYLLLLTAGDFVPPPTSPTLPLSLSLSLSPCLLSPVSCLVPYCTSCRVPLIDRLPAMSVRHRTSRFSDSQRRNSSLSDTVSEARNSIRSSTDDLFFPRAAQDTESDLGNEESHWQSAPLALALLPAIAGVFFRNGSAVVTDVTLLVLAAIFLNWSVRLPWYVHVPLLYSRDVCLMRSSAL